MGCVSLRPGENPVVLPRALGELGINYQIHTHTHTHPFTIHDKRLFFLKTSLHTLVPQVTYMHFKIMSHFLGAE